MTKNTDRCEEFAEAIVGLNAAYLSRIKAQIIKWVQNLRSQHLEAQLDVDGRYVTTLPDDMFNLINMQVLWSGGPSMRAVGRSPSQHIST